MLSIKKQNHVVFYTIKVKGSSIKKFLIIDLIIGTGIYYIIKIISSSILISSIGSIVGTEVIKRVSGFDKK